MIIIGDVQGVAFRSFVVRFVQSQCLDVSGYVRNLSDGSVEVLAQGENVSLEELRHHCSQGPRRACVTRVDVEKRELFSKPGETIYQGFAVRY